MIALCRVMGPEPPRLFGEITWSPRCSHLGYMLATSLEAVQSMRTLCGMRLMSMKSSSDRRSVSPRVNSLAAFFSCSSSWMPVPRSLTDLFHSAMSKMPPLLTEPQACSPSQMTSSGRPRSASSIIRSSQMARTSMFRRFESTRAGRFRLRSPLFVKLEIWRISSVPTWPEPMMPMAIVMSESVKPAWDARSARERSSRDTTAEMLRSEEPCAMATMLTFARPSELKKRPLMPVRRFMFSPMTARMLTPPREAARISSSCESSRAKACRTEARAGCSSRSSTATVMECSEEPWDVRITLTPALHSASIILRPTPGVPRKDAPLSVTSATFSMEVMAFTGKSSSSSSSVWSGQRSQSSPRP
mmetsp:Transcript_40646/g.116050  ORF Transcript_40646/g.116050 Transcript_40646/m.116050 type:complete len:360 (+) Transcript_40646:959-2038(+)